MKKRLFIAVDIPDEVRREIFRRVGKVPGVSVSNPAQYHLTLRFLGDKDGELLPSLCESLSKVVFPKFGISLSGTGFFPKRSRPSVFWLGVEDPEPLRALKSAIDSALSPLGLRDDEEGRKFSPHLTLARVKGRAGRDLASVLEKPFEGFAPPLFEAGCFRLWSSRLSSSGASHETEFERRLE